MVNTLLDNLWEATAAGWFLLWVVVWYALYTIILNILLGKEDKFDKVYRTEYQQHLRLKRLDTIANLIAIVSTYLIWLGSHYC